MENDDHACTVYYYSKLKTIPPAIQERETSFKETKEGQVKWYCHVALCLFYLILYSKKIFFGWNRLMCFFHTGMYLAWYLYLSKWFQYLGRIHCQPRLILAGKRSS